MSTLTPIIVANWKANKTEKEALFWVESIGNFLKKDSKEIILCPPLVYIRLIKEKLKVLNCTKLIHLGVQNISHYDIGPYTGEVTARQLSGLVEYCLVGHSERRRLFGETEKEIVQKINLAKKWQIEPILLIDSPQMHEVSFFDSEKMIVCYEPVAAISKQGKYCPADPQKAAIIAREIKTRNPKSVVLYGGSVNRDNVRSFLEVGFSGFVVGQASLDESDFIGLLRASFT